MAEEKFVLGVALDGVIADFDGGLRTMAAEWLGVPESTLAVPVSRDGSEWRLGGASGDHAEAYARLLRSAITRGDLFDDLMPIGEAPAALRRLAALDSVRLRILTDRIQPEQLCRQAFSQVADWLERYRVPYFDVCFVEDKAALGADLHVEGSIKSALALHSAGRDVVVLSTEARRPSKVQRVASWSHLEKLVEKKLSRWASIGAGGPGLKRAVDHSEAAPRARRDSSG